MKKIIFVLLLLLSHFVNAREVQVCVFRSTPAVSCNGVGVAVYFVRHGAAPIPGYPNIELPDWIPNPAYITSVYYQEHLGTVWPMEKFGGTWNFVMNDPRGQFNLHAGLHRQGAQWREFQQPVKWGDESLALSYGCQMGSAGIDSNNGPVVGGGIMPDVQICWLQEEDE